MIVQYTKTWITNVVTGEQVSGQVGELSPVSHAVRGEIRSYVGGRQRSIGRVGTSGTWPVRLVELPAAQIALLEEWMSSGATVFVRNHLGEAMYGAFFAVEFTPVKAANPAGALWSAAIEIRRVDVVEGV